MSKAKPKAESGKVKPEKNPGFLSLLRKKYRERPVVVHAPAKINLTLDVGAKQSDGYHPVRTIMQTVDLCDTVTVRLTDTGCVRLTCSDETIPTDEKNTAVKAANLFYKQLETECPGVEIAIEKKIPKEAGLAGGSTDAAAVLYALNTLHGEPFLLNQMADFSSEIGADVPFCVLRGCALATGIGEKLKPLFGLSKRLYVVICKPPVSVSTKKAYEAIDAHLQDTKGSDEQGMRVALLKQDAKAVGEKLHNVFEQAMHLPEVEDILKTMQECDSLGCRMSGSGSAVYALFSEKDAAEQCRLRLKNAGDTYLCRPC